ncbi:threonine synthase-like protein [Thermochaetoides thermophila DSM 1495]|uniref:Threonine synthase n=1 Tax=Chaetomium thermophilum (strain DSM 1495 / CBS 144.50 / IMI 039719) TaxID=759272 RepID=G0RZ80_CHATD|nr:threonine synthase-like protein [Thermochaetoides thermophila DSM 1495]EGS23508.1 threonine synthase-like protein [Thermochaetoides thermophila DSM 1495]
MSETNGITANGVSEQTHTPSQRYLSTRGEDSGLSFEEVVLKGLATDGGLYIPEEIPQAADWQSWKDLSFVDLAFNILSLYISPAEIPPADLKDIIQRSYATFRSEQVTPLIHLKDNIHLLELFHGPTFAFKDVALQFLGNLFEYFLVRRNAGKTGRDRYHLTVVGATSGDTGSAAIYGLRGKKDVSVFMLHPKGRVSPIQELQMTTVLDANVHNLAVAGNFDNCQDIVKALFADPEINATHRLGAVNSINWARILAQTVYYFHSYFALARSPAAPSGFKLGDKVRFSVPSGNFGDILAGYFAYRMGLPVDKLIVATNENDILDRFFKTGRYEKNTSSNSADPVKETLSPAMDILVSSNFERLLWFLAYEFAATAGLDDAWNKKQAGQEVSVWLRDLKTKGGFGPVHDDILSAGRRTFESERVSDEETLATIRDLYRQVGYVLDPHTAVGVEAARRSATRTPEGVPIISLSTAHPAKFAGAVNLALKDEEGFDFEAKVLPPEFVGLDKKEKRVQDVANDWKAVRDVVRAGVEEELKAAEASS